MDVNEPDLPGSYTYADYLIWEKWDQLSELINGKIFKMSPGPSKTHQDICMDVISPGILPDFKIDQAAVFSE